MPNLLTQLPSNITFDDIKRHCAALPEAGPEINLTAALPLHERQESIFIGSIGCGKTTLLRQLGLHTHPPVPEGPTEQRCYGVFDDNGQLTDMEVVRQVTAMLKHAKQQRWYQPLYKPIIVLRSTTWGRIKGHLSWVKPDDTARISFPVSAYATQLELCGMPRDIIAGYLGPVWTDNLRDSGGYFMPALAWQATRNIANQTAMTNGKFKAIAAAAMQWVVTEPQLAPFREALTFLMPEDRKLTVRPAKTSITEARIKARLRGTDHRWNTTSEFIKHAEWAGIWKRAVHKVYIPARPYVAGFSLLKYSLQKRALSDIVPT